MLMALTMVCGLATETWSRPAERDTDGYRGWVGDPVRTNELMAIVQKKRKWHKRNYLQRPEDPVRYDYESTVSQLSSRERFELENQRVAPMPEPLTYVERKVLRDYANAYTRNYVYRMIPHIVGWFP